MVEYLEPAVRAAHHEDLTDCVLRIHVVVHLSYHLYTVEHLDVTIERCRLLVAFYVFLFLVQGQLVDP